MTKAICVCRSFFASIFVFFGLLAGNVYAEVPEEIKALMSSTEVELYVGLLIGIAVALGGLYFVLFVFKQFKSMMKSG